MEHGTSFNRDELFVIYMMNISRKCRLILRTLQKGHAPLREAVMSDMQDEWKLWPTVLYVKLLELAKGKAKSLIISNSIVLLFESYRHICRKGNNATKMSIDTTNSCQQCYNNSLEARRRQTIDKVAVV